MNNVLLFIGGLLVAVLSALFAVPHFVDWNGYRGVFEEAASRVIGREVRVGGTVNVHILPTPYVRFEKVRVSDIAGGRGEPFFRADAFTMRLSIPPLLRGVLEAHEIELQRPRLQLSADAEGRGNWASIDLSPGSLPFVPAGVTLHAVRIVDGSIGFAAAGGTEAELAGISGELEAETIEGPYKFKGTASWNGAERHIRLATSSPEADGAVRLKVAVSAASSGNSYTLDGRLSNLEDNVRLDGEILGKMQVDGLVAKPAADAAAKTAADETQRPYLDLKASVAADLTDARFEQIAVSVENVGQPQIVSGRGRFDWAPEDRSRESVTELALSSRWLDLDRLAGRAAADQPVETARALVAALLGQLPGKGKVDARFDVEQASLGGEAVSGLGLRLVRDKGPLELRELKAGLPGGARLDISGTLEEGQGKPELDGLISVHGSSLVRFLTWAGKSRDLAEGSADGPFLVRGKLRLGETGVAMTDFDAELQGAPLSGEVRYSVGDRRRVVLRLDGRTIDLAQLWGGALNWLPKPEAASAAPSAGASGDPDLGPDLGESRDTPRFDASTTDLELEVRFAELVAGGYRLRDVDADLSIENGRLSISRLRLGTPDGLALDLEGELVGIEGKPKGTLRGLVAADNPSAVGTLLKALGDGAPSGADDARIAALAPLRLAGRVSLGERSATAADIDADGTVQGGRFVAALRFDGGWKGWREGPGEMRISADSPDVDNLVRIALSAPGEAPRGRAPRRGQLSFKAQGVPSQGMLATATIEAPGLVLSYDGPLELRKGVATAIDGEVRIAADRIADALDLVGVPVGSAAADIPVEGVLAVTARDHVLTIKPRELTVGTRRVGGKLEVAQHGGRPSTVTAALEVGEVVLADLLKPLLIRPVRAAAQVAAAAPDTLSDSEAPFDGWPELAFDFGPLDRLEGTVELRFAGLRVKDGLALGGGKLLARLAPGRLDAEVRDAALLDGRAGLSLSLTKARGGVDGKLTVDLAGFKPQATPQGAGGRPGEPASLSLALDLTGRGQSPRMVIDSLKGHGQLQVASPLALKGLTPEVVSTVADAFVSGKIEPADGAFAAALEAALATSVVTIPAGHYAVEATDGALRVKPVILTSGGGRTTVDTTLSLADLRLDSEWRIEAGAAQAPAPGTAAAGVRRQALPPVQMVYTGGLEAVGALAPRLASGALERELAVRRMERDVDELERIRKEDERRRAAEEERTRRIEVERRRLEATPPVAAPVPPVPQPVERSALPNVVAPPAPRPSAGEAPVRPPPAPKPARRLSPSEEIVRQLPLN